MFIEISSRITTVQFLVKSQVYSSVNAYKRVPYVARAQEQVVH